MNFFSVKLVEINFRSDWDKRNISYEEVGLNELFLGIELIGYCNIHNSGVRSPSRSVNLDIILESKLTKLYIFPSSFGIVWETCLRPNYCI